MDGLPIPGGHGLVIAGKRIPPVVLFGAVLGVAMLFYLRGRQAKATAAATTQQPGLAYDAVTGTYYDPSAGYNAGNGALGQLESNLASLQGQVSQLASNQSATQTLPSAPPPNVTTPSTPSPTAPSVDPTAAYFTSLYQQELGRAPDPGGLAYWTGQAQQQGIPLATAAFQASGETLGSLVSGVYKQDLNRAPDAPGLAYWTGYLQQGHTVQQLDAAVKASAEYTAAHHA